MTHLDYSYKQYYPKWERGNDENLITSLKKDYIEIILYREHVCDKVNDLFETSFKPLEAKTIDSELGYKIKEYLTKKEINVTKYDDVNETVYVIEISLFDDDDNEYHKEYTLRG